MSLKPICIAIDAMGGDTGVAVTIPAARAFLRGHPDARVLLVGRPDDIQGELARDASGEVDGRITVVAATEVVTSSDPPAQAMRSKRDSSMRVAIEQVKAGTAQACVSAGNTGALMAISRLVLRMMEGIDRPAIAAQLPHAGGGAVTMLDLGANVDCDATNLLQFAVMGQTLATVLDGKPQPRIGLLNIGEEAIKGNEVVKEAAELIADAGLAFHGNVEGTDIYRGTVDVIVCDGFVGNVALKTSEGLAQMLGQFLKEEFTRNLLTKLVAAIAYPVLRRFRDRIDHRRYNGAILIGLRGIVFKSHGSSDAFGFEQALRRAHDAARNDLIGKIATALPRGGGVEEQGVHSEGAVSRASVQNRAVQGFQG